MKKLFLCGAVALVGCSGGQLTPTGQQLVTILCAVDTLAPTGVAAGGALAQIIVPDSAGDISKMNQAEQLFHPQVQAACAALQMKPAAVTTNPVAPGPAVAP